VSDDLTLDNCGCCEPEPEPSPIYNRPGLPALSYRAGTYPTFLRRMFNRLAAYALPDGDHAGDRPLAALSTRELDDPAVALLDASAVVADVLTFYQERIANEGFLRTSIERASILELAREIGYELSPGVAASTYLAFTLEDASGAPKSVEIAEGTKVQSVPPQDKLPQSFETTESITAHAQWNAIRPRMTRRQDIWTDSKRIFLDGTSTNLKKGDRVLIVVQQGNSKLAELKRVYKVEVDQDNKRTTVDFSAYPSITTLGGPSVPWGTVDINVKLPLNAANVTQYIIDRNWDNDDLNTFLTVNEWDSEQLLTYLAEYRALYPEVSGEAYAMRQSAPFFGHTAPRRATLPNKSGDQTLNWGQDWDSGWQIWMNQVTNQYYVVADVNLDHTLQGILPESWVVIEKTDGAQMVCKISEVKERSLWGFGLSAKMTGLNLKNLSGAGLQDDASDKPGGYHVDNSIAQLQSELLPLCEMPDNEMLSKGSYIMLLNGLVPGLSVGQAIMLSGERWDADGVMASEALVIKEIQHFSGYTYLSFEGGFQHNYKRDSVTFNANVARATHGETTSEILGSGSGAQTNQRFSLRKPPLTHTSAATASGTESTLEMRVNDLLWTESSSLYPLGPNDQQYVIRIGDDGQATIIFGDGRHGARLPTGTNNVVATYRSGIGLDGEVEAGTLTMLASKPLGLKSATNPNAASGGDDPEVLDNARANAPLTVRTLDRIVSLADYEDFARAFAGVGKAQAVDLWSGETHLVHVTVAGADGDPIDQNSDLFTNLVGGINNNRDPEQIVRVDSFQRLLFNLQAKVAVDSPRYIKADVFDAIEDALQEAFAFEKRAFGQMVTSAEVITIIQQIEGVIAVDLDYLYLSSDSAEFETLLPAQIARVNENGLVQLAQLLVINPIGVTLEEMMP
jgi:uncharacterized phage protein gp47/JayE